MRHHKIDNRLFLNNRRKFMARMKSNSIAVFNSNDVYPISTDSVHPFVQNSDFIYLSGIDQPESIIVLCPDAPNEGQKEILFIKKTDTQISRWNGDKLSPQKAYEVSGIRHIHWLENLEQVLAELMVCTDTMYINTNEYHRASSDIETREGRFVKWWKEKYPAHQVAKSASILQEIRPTKEAIEIKALSAACSVTKMGYESVMRNLKHGMKEYEVEAILLSEYIKVGASGFSMPPIIASGANNNVLHYTANDLECSEGDLLLLDAGAKYGHYASDISRTIPISGKFTDRQKEVYNAVLRIRNTAINLLRPGITWAEHHKEVVKYLISELIQLGIISKDDEPNAYLKYYMHATTHHIGLDNHDYGHHHLPFQPNMVLAVEPGIYIDEEGFGVRLEDVVLIQENGPNINLSEAIPVEAEEIESIMNNQAP